MSWRELSMAALVLVCFACGSLSFMTPKPQVGMGLSIIGMACGAAAFWLYLTRPK